MSTIDLQSPRFLASERHPADDATADKNAVVRHAPPASSDEDYRVAASLAHRNPA